MKKQAFNVIRFLSRFFATAALTLTFVSASISIDTAQAQQSATEQDAYAIGVDAYIYFYSLVTMDITRKQISNIEPGKGFGGPMNSFANIPAYPAADMKVVVRPNFDTLYSSGWLDLTKQPVVVSVPDTAGRYYLLPMLDNDQEGFQVANSLNRFAVSSWMPFQFNPDGALDLYFQDESPGAEKEANWLQAPKGPFNLCLRLYAPKSEALTGKWNPPSVMRVQEGPPLTTQ